MTFAELVSHQYCFFCVVIMMQWKLQLFVKVGIPHINLPRIAELVLVLFSDSMHTLLLLLPGFASRPLCRAVFRGVCIQEGEAHKQKSKVHAILKAAHACSWCCILTSDVYAGLIVSRKPFHNGRREAVVTLASCVPALMHMT